MKSVKLTLMGLFLTIGVSMLMAFLWIPCRWYGTDARYFPEWANGFGVGFWIAGCGLAIGFIIWYLMAFEKRIK